MLGIAAGAGTRCMSLSGKLRLMPGQGGGTGGKTTPNRTSHERQILILFIEDLMIPELID